MRRFDATGAIIAEWGPWSEDRPDTVTVGPGSDVYTSGPDRSVVDRFDGYGDRLGMWGGKGSGPGEFCGDDTASYNGCRVGDLAVEADGLVYAGDPANGRIQRFTRDGHFVDALVPERWRYDWQFPAGRFDVHGGGPDARLLLLDGDGGRVVYVFGTEAPDAWRGEYYGNDVLAERPVKVEYRADLDLAWDEVAPALNIPVNGLSARFQRYVSMPPDDYAFTLTSQGGVRFWIDDALVMDRWDGADVTATVTLPLDGTRHDLLVEYRGVVDTGALSVTWGRTERRQDVYLPAAGRE